jgi:hypothetical protein
MFCALILTMPWASGLAQLAAAALALGLDEPLELHAASTSIAAMERITPFIGRVERGNENKSGPFVS